MDWRRLSEKLRTSLQRLFPPMEDGSTRPLHEKNESGVALFMVLSSMTILALIAVELTWTAQVNQRIAYDGRDQLQAHYLAKTGFKLSLLRLKAYQQVKAITGSLGSGASSMIPKRALDQIWAFPFFFPPCLVSRLLFLTCGNNWC